MTEQQIKEEILRYIKDQTYNYAVYKRSNL